MKNYRLNHQQQEYAKKLAGYTDLSISQVIDYAFMAAQTELSKRIAMKIGNMTEVEFYQAIADKKKENEKDTQLDNGLAVD